ncbi:MAG: hypothetical protein HUK01_05995 [Bacteroidaceae bacterium]|nr:hypothetical protein [Bacteroidaceae bacterium]
MEFEDELMLSAEDDARCVEYIKAYLPQELKERFDEEKLYYFLDVIYEYYANSGILDQDADADGCIDIDMEALAAHMAEQAKKDNIGDFAAEDLLWIANGEAEYSEQAEE